MESFYSALCNEVQSRRQSFIAIQEEKLAVADSRADPAAVDVCVPYYNLGDYLPYLLASLEGQTEQRFNLFVVNDGSTEPGSIQSFDAMAEKYRDRSTWRFVTTENQGVSRARNFAASLGSAEYLCFVDPDNIAAPYMIERFLQAIAMSSDDCLTCYMYCFEGDGDIISASGTMKERTFSEIPLGNFPIGGVLDSPYGDGNCILRRSVFEALGGFTTDVPDSINHEDQELLARLSLADYAIDVIPEFLVYYRLRQHSRLRTTDPYLNTGRVIRHYESALKAHGLEDLVPLSRGLQLAVQKADATAKV